MDVEQPLRHLSGAGLALPTRSARREHLFDETHLAVGGGPQRPQVPRLDPELLQPDNGLDDLLVLAAVAPGAVGGDEAGCVEGLEQGRCGAGAVRELGAGQASLLGRLDSRRSL